MTNKLPHIEILGVKVHTLTLKQSINIIEEHINNNKVNQSLLIVKPYVSFLVQAHRDHAIRRLLNQAGLSLADGISLQWAASFLYGEPHTKPSLLKILRSVLFWLQKKAWVTQIIPERGAGVDTTIKLLQTASRYHWRVGVISGRADETNRIESSLKARIKGLNVSVWQGYFDPGSEQEQKIIQKVKQENLDLLFIARGFPLQEKFMFDHTNDALAKVQIAEGGTFDYDQLGGKVRRAPKPLRRIGFEWLWRAFTQSSKITNLIIVPNFIWLIYRMAIKQK